MRAPRRLNDTPTGNTCQKHVSRTKVLVLRLARRGENRDSLPGRRGSKTKGERERVRTMTTVARQRIIDALCAQPPQSVAPEKFWLSPKMLAIEAIESVKTRFANMDGRSRKRWLASHRPPGRKGGRPRSRISGSELRDQVLELRALYEKRDGKKYSLRAFLVFYYREYAAKAGRPVSVAIARQKTKHALNRISAAK